MHFLMFFIFFNSRYDMIYMLSILIKKKKKKKKLSNPVVVMAINASPFVQSNDFRIFYSK